ncbi:GNAT family N-acetyltransferase [Aurantiacibacter sediminis]|uniref:N-acetyltransferase n=1 Tax=Aurantiacibacter sediminis TaxID=2793064 RepID=A0ABS0N5H4_9SPHN|nr:N-acetyltransferase [Aurantiacibacter sediminis]MBH5323049.1 N-acetyltransferase [Aurantiacibacter sediminis]
MKDNAKLIPLEAVPADMFEEVLDRAFGADRHGRTAYKVRAGVEWLPALSFAALDDEDMLVGTIQVWPVALSDPQDRRHPMLMVGPVAVVPDRQGEGFGLALMAAMTQAMDSEANLPQVMIGDPEYYGRFGFSAAPTKDWSVPGPYEPHRLLVRTAYPSILPGTGTLGPWIG